WHACHSVHTHSAVSSFPISVARWKNTRTHTHTHTQTTLLCPFSQTQWSTLISSSYPLSVNHFTNIHTGCIFTHTHTQTTLLCPFSQTQWSTLISSSYPLPVNHFTTINTGCILTHRHTQTHLNKNATEFGADIDTLR